MSTYSILRRKLGLSLFGDAAVLRSAEVLTRLTKSSSLATHRGKGCASSKNPRYNDYHRTNFACSIAVKESPRPHALGDRVAHAAAGFDHVCPEFPAQAGDMDINDVGRSVGVFVEKLLIQRRP